MKILLVSPAQEHTVNSFSEATDIVAGSVMPNLALPTLAALVPTDMEVTLIDETVERIDFDAPYDLVGITGYHIHAARMFELAAEFRRRNVPVAIGGPFASLSSAKVRPHADVLFIGEAEETWPQFLSDFRDGIWKDEYRAAGTVDIERSPIPDFSRVRSDLYYLGVVQTSRGCPFECEFCDAIVFLGRNQRYKRPARVVEELDQLYRLGYRNVFLADDNFTAYRKKAMEIVQAVTGWSAQQAEPMFLATQISIDAAREPTLLNACAQAGLRYAFVGIETPNKDALRESRKRQNVKADLVADVHAFHRCGVAVYGGLIVGFDADTTGSFRALYEYLQAAGIPIASFTILNAPDGTPLYRRLEREGRLKPLAMGDKHLGTNIVLKQMTESEVLIGSMWLANKVYAASAFRERVRVLAENLPSDLSRATMTQHTRALWPKVETAYAELGPEFESIPAESVELFAERGMDLLIPILVPYKHLVALFRKWGIWSPEMAHLDAPPFPSGTADFSKSPSQPTASVAAL